MEHLDTSVWLLHVTWESWWLGSKRECFWASWEAGIEGQGFLRSNHRSPGTSLLPYSFGHGSQQGQPRTRAGGGLCQLGGGGRGEGKVAVQKGRWAEEWPQSW